MSKTEYKSLYQQTGLSVGKAYSRQKIRIALCKIYDTSVVLQWFAHFERLGFIELTTPNPLSANQDFLTIKRDFLNGK